MCVHISMDTLQANLIKTSKRQSARSLLLAGLGCALLAGCASEPLPIPAPPQARVAPLPDTRVFVYPSAGQSASQLERDRYECHNWAVKQTGFDPSASQAAPHQRVEVVAVPASGSDTLAGATAGALIGASVSRPRDAGGGALFGAVAGALLGAASDSARAQRAADTERRLNEANQQGDLGLDHLAGNYRRALGACLQGRGYQTR